MDIRTVAGRLGHGGGGTTTLRVYAAWVSESDQRAAGNLGARMPARPTELPVRRRMTARVPYPYEVIASALREQIESGKLSEDEFLPGIKALAAMHGVGVGTAHRAVHLLVNSGQVEVVSGRGTRVAGRADPTAD